MQKRQFATVALVAWSLMTATASAEAIEQEVNIVLRYDSAVDVARSRLLLEGPDGEATALLPEPGFQAVELKADMRHLFPGDYHLHWQVLSEDGTLSQGEFPFSIGSSIA